MTGERIHPSGNDIALQLPPRSEGNTAILQVARYFQEREFGGKPIPGQEQLLLRLQELSQGRSVPIILFNCLDFDWLPDGTRYPLSIISDDTETAIAGYFQPNIEDAMHQLQRLGNPNLAIIIPDSELFDDRPFSFAQSIEERMAIAHCVKTGLNNRLRTMSTDNTVMLWSEFCAIQGLASPADYTTANYNSIRQNPKFDKKIRDQAKDSKKYFERNGLYEEYIRDIDEQDLIDRVAWYCAMYAGEGQALAESRSIVINLEDGRVSAWYQRGSDGNLPIVTPVNSKEFYTWRSQLKAA